MKNFITSTSQAIILVAVTALCLSTTAQAQEKAKPKKDRGPVVSVDVALNTITINKKKGGSKTLKLAPGARVKPKTVGGLAGIKPGMNVICYSPAEGGDVQVVRVSEPKPEAAPAQ